jgi:hypothetical protein
VVCSSFKMGYWTGQDKEAKILEEGKKNRKGQ